MKNGKSKIRSGKCYCVKKAAKLAEINAEVIIREIRGKPTRDVVYKKWQKISAHTGRRSGATNMYIAGIPEHTIMKITGHKTVQAFEAYLCLPDVKHLEIMQRNPFLIRQSSFLPFRSNCQLKPSGWSNISFSSQPKS